MMLPVVATAQTTTPTASSTKTAEGTRKDPIPRGQSVEIGDWTVEIVGFRQNANEIVAAENQFNDPPAVGRQFVIATMEITYHGSDIGDLTYLQFKAVGESNVAYTTFDDSCGVVPNDPYSVSDIFTDGTVKVNYCWSVKSSDVKSLLIYGEELLNFDDEPVFLNPRKN